MFCVSYSTHTVPFSDIIIMIAHDAIIIVTIAIFYKEFQALSFDEEFSEIAGVPTQTLYLLSLCLVALSIIVLIRVVGIILVLALLTIPGLIARQFTERLSRLMLYSTLFTVILTIAGLWMSYMLDLASGATTVLVLCAGFVAAVILKRLARSRQHA